MAQIDISIISILCSAIVAVVAVVGLLFSFFKVYVAFENRLTKLETRMEPLWNKLMELTPAFRRQLPRSNPDSAIDRRRDELLDKMEAGTLTAMEARELRNILTGQFEQAKQQANLMSLLAFVFLIALLAGIAGTKE